jgi:alpha-galactosidase
MRHFIIFVLLLLTTSLYGQKFEGLALIPPMGWNSWNKFACDVNEALIRETAETMVSSGLKEVGYQYIVIDDCWHGKRDSLGFIQPDPERFPSGIKALADYIHGLGLKFGIYSDAGWRTCGGKPGSRGYEYQDAMQYAQWGVDYLKYDWCNTEKLNAEGAYLTMCDALYAAGRPVVFSLCEWGNHQPWLWAKNIGHLWRTTGDIIDCFDCVVDHGTWKSWGILQILDKQEGLRVYAGPDHWNDPDMMEVGNGMSVSEDRAHFTMWCMLAAPLIAGNDLRNMSQETIDILTNKEAIAVDQDPLGIQGYKYLAEDNLEIWFRPLSEEAWAVCFLNRGEETITINFSWQKHNQSDSFSQRMLNFSQKSYQVRDLWAHRDRGSANGDFKAELASHDVILLKLIPVE